MKDDRSGCPEDAIYIHFTYTPLSDDGYEGIDHEDGEVLDLFIFNDGGLLVRQLTTDEFNLDRPLRTELLNKGKYTFVSWGNLGGEYELFPRDYKVGSTFFEEFSVSLKHDNIVRFDPRPLHHGIVENVEIDSAGRHIVEIPVTQNTHVLNFAVKGLNPSNQEGYKISIQDNNTRYDFNNNFLRADHIHYKAQCQLEHEHEIHTATQTVMRLDRGREVNLSIQRREDGREVYGADLVALILKLDDIDKRVDFSKMHKFDIGISIDRTGTDMKVVISINGWVVVDQAGDIG